MKTQLEKYIPVISQQTLFAEQLTLPPDKAAQLAGQAAKGFAGGGLIAAIVFLYTSLSFSGTLLGFTAIVLAPVWMPAVIALLVAGATITAVIHYLGKIGVMKGNKKTITKSFNCALDELAVFVYKLILEPSIAVLSTCGKINEPRRQKIKTLLLDWGYSPEWIESQRLNIEKIDPSVIEKTTSIIWREYRFYEKKLGRAENGKNLDSIIKDLPNPNFLRDKIVKIAVDLLSGEDISNTQREYLEKISKF